MPAWLRNLHVEARHHWHVLRRHVPYYDNWRARRGLRQRLERMPKPLKPREAHQNLSSVAIDTSSSPHPQCLLLSRLPPELRLQIYEEVFKDDSYKQPSHLTTIKGRLAALPMCADCDCKNHDEEARLQRLSLLKTCRQIYIEAVPVLYSTWKFYLRDMDTLIHLSETLLPQRLATIRTLHITVPVCFNHEPYGTLESGWKIIATKMTGLRDFGVTWLYYVCDNHPSDLSGWDISRERKYLEPLLEIRGLDIFYLEYDPYDVPDDDEDEDPIDVSAEAMAFKAHLKEVMCTRSKQTPYGGDGATLAVDGP